MEQVSNLADKRQQSFCYLCGGYANTKDHVPSRVFLDLPYPDFLLTAPCCNSCNNDLSNDEEYVACMIECAIHGSTEPRGLSRPKVAKILANKPDIGMTIKNSMILVGGRTMSIINTVRLRIVLDKLARAHIAAEMNEPLPDAEIELQYSQFDKMDVDTRNKFEEPMSYALLPEVCSRVLQRGIIIKSGQVSSQWIEVQPNRYRYMVCLQASFRVKFVLSEYLACEATLRYP